MLALSHTFATLALLPCVALVRAASFQVQVGAAGNLEYTPSSLIATDGDTVVFTFNPKNHTATQTSFAAPCAPLSGGFDTGFVPVSSGSTPTTKTFTIPAGTGTKPLWFSCAQLNHCQQGMVFAINPPTAATANNTFDAFKANAQGPAGVATSTASGSATPTNTEGSHNPTTASGSVFSAASVNDGATGSATIADVPTTTANVPSATGPGGATGGSGSGSGGSAAPTSKSSGAMSETRVRVRDSALAIGAVFFGLQLGVIVM